MRTKLTSKKKKKADYTLGEILDRRVLGHMSNGEDLERALQHTFGDYTLDSPTTRGRIFRAACKVCRDGDAYRPLEPTDRVWLPLRRKHLRRAIQAVLLTI